MYARACVYRRSYREFGSKRVLARYACDIISCVRIAWCERDVNRCRRRKRVITRANHGAYVLYYTGCSFRARSPRPRPRAKHVRFGSRVKRLKTDHRRTKRWRYKRKTGSFWFARSPQRSPSNEPRRNLSLVHGPDVYERARRPRQHRREPRALRRPVRVRFDPLHSLPEPRDRRSRRRLSTTATPNERDLHGSTARNI